MFAGLFALLTKALGRRTGNVNQEESWAVLKRPYLYFYCTEMAPCAKRAEWMMHLYSTLLCITVHPKRFTIMWGGISSTTTSVQHPLGWCDGSHRTTAPVGSPHTSYRWREERVIEPIKCALTTHQLQVERRESHRANQVCAHHTPATGGEERES